MTTTRRFVRPARPEKGPKAPAVTELRLEPPTELPKPVPPSRIRMIMPVIMVIGMGGMMFMMFRSSGTFSPTMLFFPMMMLVSMFGMIGGGLGGNGGGGAAGLNEERKDYLRSIGDNRRTVHTAEAELYEYLRHTHPGPAELARLVGGKRMWEVQVSSPQFLRVRIGRGRIANQVRVIVPEAAPTSDLDPVGVVEVTRFAKAYSTVGGMPVAINLLSVPQVGFDGDPEATAALLRAMLAEIAVLHGPDQVAIAAVVADPDAPRWSWLKWLPHTQHPSETDALGSSRMVYRSVGELRSKVLAGLQQMGLTYRGLYGEGSEVVGNFFQISNQTTLGRTEEELLDHLTRVVRHVIEREEEARRVLLRDAGYIIEDKLWRAYGTLRHARSLSFDEAMNLLSGLRLAVGLKLMTGLSVYTLNKLLIFSQLAHLVHGEGRALTQSEGNLSRARFVRQVLAHEAGTEG